MAHWKTARQNQPRSPPQNESEFLSFETIVPRPGEGSRAIRRLNRWLREAERTGFDHGAAFTFAPGGAGGALEDGPAESSLVHRPKTSRVSIVRDHRTTSRGGRPRAIRRLVPMAPGNSRLMVSTIDCSVRARRRRWHAAGRRPGRIEPRSPPQNESSFYRSRPSYHVPRRAPSRDSATGSMAPGLRLMVSTIDCSVRARRRRWHTGRRPGRIEPRSPPQNESSFYRSRPSYHVRRAPSRDSATGSMAPRAQTDGFDHRLQRPFAPGCGRWHTGRRPAESSGAPPQNASRGLSPARPSYYVPRTSPRAIRRWVVDSGAQSDMPAIKSGETPVASEACTNIAIANVRPRVL